MSVASEKETTPEIIVLTETGLNTGVFTANVLFDATGAVSSDGSLQVDAGDKITAKYRDPADDFGNVQTLTSISFYAMTQVTSGPLSGNTTWTKANSPYFLTGDVIVPDSVTLTIEPGVNVRFKANMDDLSSGEDANRIEIRVSGTLKANGNVTDSIHFISNSQNPSAGDWYGIVSYDDGTSASNWDKTGALDVSYARVSNYIHGIYVRDYSDGLINGIYYGWGNTLSPDSIKVHNTVFQSGGDAYYTNEHWAFRPLEFVNNRVYNASIRSHGVSAYKKIENNTFKHDRSGNPIEIYVRAGQRNGTYNGIHYPQRMRISFSNNHVDYGYFRFDGHSEVSSYGPQNAAFIDLSLIHI